MLVYGGGESKFVRISIPLAILIFLIIPRNIYATELSTICTNPNNQCTLQENYPDITNHAHFNGGIGLNQKTITNLINYGTLGNIAWDGGTITHLTNYGTMGNVMGIRAQNPTPTTMSVTNYGVMGGIETEYGDKDIFINNYGVINPSSRRRHFEGGNYHFIFEVYAMIINESADSFKNNKGDTTNNNNSHIVFSNQGKVKFKDNNSKLILDFGENFDFGEAYPLDKLIIDTSGNNKLQVDFSRLTVTSDIYLLSQRGDNFVVDFVPQYGIVGTLHKSNIRTMNNFYTMSNALIYPRKSYKSQNLWKSNLVILRERSDRRISKSNIRDSSPKAQNDNGRAFANNGILDSALFVNSTLDSAIPLKSYESFAYRNEAINRRIQRQNKRNYNRKSQNQTQNLKEPQTFSQNLAQNPHNYYFILTPFLNYNSFAQSGNYNLSGFDYGFLTAFSAKVAESNNTISSLGAHFIFSYGSLGDSKDKEFSITNLNLNVGINYKFDMIWDMYLKARGDFFYFLNQVKTLTMLEAIKPNNLGFGASVIFGKDFNFGKGGVLGIEAGIDYKALKTNEVSLNSQSYKQSLLNLIYADLGVNYNKYFGGFGINLGTGFKANLAPKLATSALLINSQTLKFTLDNDKYLAYANAGISYLLNTKNFDMEFSLAYYGNFGDRVMSNGAGVEWRVGW